MALHRLSIRITLAAILIALTATAAYFATRKSADALREDWAPLFAAVDLEFQPASSTAPEGETLSQTQCSLCHLRPAPAILPKASWREVFGIHTARFQSLDILEGPERGDPSRLDSLEVSRLALPRLEHREVRIQKSDFAKIAYYYLTEAPETAPPAKKPAMSPSPAPFALHASAPMGDTGALIAGYTSAAFLPDPKRILLGDTGNLALQVYDATGQHLWAVPLGGVFPASILQRPDGIYVVMSGPTLGSIAEPELDPSGRMVRLPGSILEHAPDASTPEAVLEGLRFPVHGYFADLNADGNDDILVEEFGKSQGALAWYEQAGGAYAQKHILYDGPGALSSTIGDMNGDGRPDVVAMVTQADEKIFLFSNLGGGAFETKLLLQEQPAFGFDALYLHDMDNDGNLEMITVNGDNDLATEPLRSYHGVRVWRQTGQDGLQEAYFYPLHGAMQAVIRDFDLDGDLDIVASSFWPDLKAQPVEAAVYLENTGGLAFVPHPIPGTEHGKWAVVESGDFDGDGDEDLVFGALYMPGSQDKWKKALGREPLGHAIYRNTTR